MERDIRIALVTCNSPVGRIADNLASMAVWTVAAADAAAGIVCFPELNVTGYCNRSELADVAQSVPGPATDRIRQMAADTGMVILAGLAERDDAGRIFATHVVIAPDGRTDRYRKLYIAPPERGIFSPGQTIPLFCALGVTFGIQLCYDAHFPELATHMADKGAELIFVPHASPRGDALTKHQSWMRHLPARAYDNSLFVAACNQTGENCNGLTFPGNAVVFGPSGDIIGSDVTEKEGLLVVDLEKAALEYVRSHPMRHFFPNRRPELYVSGT